VEESGCGIIEGTPANLALAWSDEQKQRIASVWKIDASV
jgi:hypothetical protein